MEKITFTVKEVAALIGVSVHTIYDLVRKKQIPHFKIGSKIMFRVDSIQTWIKQNEIPCREVV
ncbi:helix-turn-helix domain-containing protein [Paenibacillus chitinolyticus]|uniref:helix-turn-helix domain-containing protein n=1 Tax=Paenibacillus chitinolyticus TaxID=79263 RepID=UPI003648D3CF